MSGIKTRPARAATKSADTKRKSRSSGSKQRRKHYRIWLEIEECDIKCKCAQYRSGGDLGILPDPIGRFDTLEDAKKYVWKLILEHGSELTCATSACNPLLKEE